jgi:hypothetical protein
MFAGSVIIASRPKSARRAWPVWSISMFALTGKLSTLGWWWKPPKTYPLEIPVNHSLAMDINQAPSNVFQLGEVSGH